MRIEFTVHGTPQPQGSTRAFMPKGARFPVVTSDNAKLKPWRQDVAAMAQTAMLLAMPEPKPVEAPVSVTCEFWFLKPKSAGRKVTQKITKPDLDKCLRSVLDSMTGIVFRDDSQVVHCMCAKRFSDSPGARIRVETCGV